MHGTYGNQSDPIQTPVPGATATYLHPVHETFMPYNNRP